MPRSPRWCTADAGLFTFEVPGGTGEVWMLTRDGAWTRIGDHVVGIPMTDIAGHHAFWTERDRGFRVVAYSTADEQVVDMLPIPDLRFVHAVDDDQAFVGEGEDWWLWTAGGGTRDTPVLVRDFRAGTGDVVLRIGPSYRGVGLVRDGDGTVLRRDRALDSGILDADGSAVVLLYRNGQVFDVRTLPELHEVALTPERLLESRPTFRDFSWTADGRLVIEGGRPERTLLCTVPAGVCEQIASRDEGYVGSWGQFLINEPDDDGE